MTTATLAAALWSSSSFAQTDMMAMSHNSAANQLGVLEYCQAQGYTDASAVTAQKGVIARMPAYSGSTEAAEASGKQGTITGAGTTMSLSDMATKSNTTEAVLCQKMADNTKQVAASNQAAFGPGGVPNMPAMPGGMPSGMPAMPGGMPTMPGMPATPPTH